MYDMHYDLLTILYFNMIKNNKFSNIEKMERDLSKIYRNGNILGGIINLYFMTPGEMKEELDITVEEMQNLKEMFLKSIQFLNRLKDKKIIPNDIDFIYSIEGCDYIKSIEELEELYQIGLRSILPVWNHQNQYGSGIRTMEGLTQKGQELIQKAIDLGMIVDVSHANEQTFYDILEVYEKSRKPNSILIASHSNVRSLCDRERNLTDGQLCQLKKLGGYIGLFTNGNFITIDNKKMDFKERQKIFMKHLDYVIHVIGFDVSKIIISTDDMNFHPNSTYHHLEAFPIETIKTTLFQFIQEQYGETIARKIMIENARDIIQKVKFR